MPVIGATELQPVNILGSYVQGLEMGRANKLMRQQQAATEAEARSNALLDEAKLAEQRNKATQEETKSLASRVEFLRRMIPADPRLAPAWVAASYQDPIVGPMLSQYAPQEEVIAGIPRDPEGYMRWAEGASMFADELSKRRTVTAENLLPYNQPLSPEVLAQKKELAGAGAARSVSNVNLPRAQTAYETEGGKAAFGADQAAFDAAQTAAAGLEGDYEAINLLRSGKPATGITADLELQVNRFKAALIKDKRSVEKVSDTELLNSVLGKDVFTNIQALGIGARGLDTPAEREYLREVVSGTGSLNKETLLRMAQIRANIKERAINRFNERIERGELDRFFNVTGRQKVGIEKPTAPAAAPSGPKVGTVENGYRYKGGDPSKPASWEKVK